MKRSVVKHGPSTYIISLPSKWVKENDVKKGSELDVDEQGNKIIICAQADMKPLEAKIDITGLDRSMIMYTLRGYYRMGYDTLYVTFNNPTAVYQRDDKSYSVLSIIHTEINRLIGYEIIQEKEKSCVIKDLQGTTEKEFDQILRRIFFLLIDTSKDLLSGLKTNNIHLLETIENKHDTITKFISYCLRTLNKQGYSEPRKTAYYYHIIATLDRITDIIKYAARNAKAYNNKLSKDVLKIIELIVLDIINYHSLFYNYTKEKVLEIDTNRYAAEKALKGLPPGINNMEMIITTGMFQILEIILDLVEARAALEY